MWKKLGGFLLKFLGIAAAVLLLTFFLLKSGQQDVVDRMMAVNPELASANSPQQTENQKQELRRQLGLNLPAFYFRLTSSAIPSKWPDQLSPVHRKTLEAWAIKTGDYQGAFNLIGQLKEARNSSQGQTSLSFQLSLQQKDLEKVKSTLSQMDYAAIQTDIDVSTLAKEVDNLLAQSSASTWVPAIRFYGQNQFHQWLFGNGENTKGILRGDFGMSYVQKRPVVEILAEKIGWSFLLGFIALLLAFGFGIPLGIWLAKNKFGNTVMSWLYLVYAIPSFWLATLLLMFFANPDYLNWFPIGGVEPISGFADGFSWWDRLFATIPYTILPLVCFSYGSIIYISRISKQSAAEVLNSNFVRAARLRAVPRKNYWKYYILKNAILPTITILGAVLPLLVGGSVIIETIFDIPGMGNQLFSAAQKADVPVVMSITLITALLSVVGYHLADKLYQWVDPRIKLTA